VVATAGPPNTLIIAVNELSKQQQRWQIANQTIQLIYPYGSFKSPVTSSALDEQSNWALRVRALVQYVDVILNRSFV